MIRVQLPFHLRNLAKVTDEVNIEVAAPVTIGAILDALEKQYPALGGTMRDYATGRRRALVRFFACGEDHSFTPFDQPLPASVASGEEPFLVVGAIAGG